MPGDADKTPEQLQKQARDAFDALQRGATGEVRKQAIDRLALVDAELSRRLSDPNREDSADVTEARRYVREWRSTLTNDTDTPATPAQQDSTDTATVDSGGPGEAPDSLADIPRISGVSTQIEKLNTSRRDLCSFLRADRPLTADDAVKADWDSKHKKRLVKMILAEEELLQSVARHWVPYSAEDAARLNEGYQAVGALRGKFAEIARNDATVRDYDERLGDIKQIHEGLQGGMSGGLRDDDVYKGEKKIAGKMDKIGTSSESLNRRKMIKQVEEMTDQGAGNKALKESIEAEKRLSKSTRGLSKMGKIGAKGDFGQAYAGFADGMYRLLHQETQRALMRVEAANNALVTDVDTAREQLAQAHADVIDRRQTKALELINKRLKDAGEPPLTLHTMSDADIRNYLDGPLQEMHLADTVARNFGDEAAKRTTGLPTSALAKFRRSHGQRLDEDALKTWCRDHPAKKISRKTGAILGGSAALLIALVALLLTSVGDGGDDDGPVLGTGDVQVTIRWNSTTDIDLHVTDPAGDTVYYDNKTVASGGELDVDALADCDIRSENPVENVFWPTGDAPTGEYVVKVDYYKQCEGAGPETVQVTTKVNGEVESYEVTLTPNETIEVTRFTR